MSDPYGGYYVRPDAPRRQAHVYDEQRVNVTKVRDELMAAFDRDRNTLGNDEYGAELAKKLPGIEERIFSDLKAFITNLEGATSGLHTTAGNYEQAEPPWASGS
ncbi:hypothetical protein [Streptosporangium lutulentum]|uniref:Uncharacterized protein n=1 Tax=Streptosporangium lutulentum TaxID=1461250 RepID=A0ABT9QRV5_9ACTN|nr:hypothetical protein [Streptosporangium lutulentum]MDP9848664.1 hypothetical protein [Streptosporangium lutulentum]